MKSLELPEVEFPQGMCQFVATPIGNLGDMTLRGLAVLAAADVVYAEDTRHTRRLLARYGIAAKLASYRDHNKTRQIPRIVDRLKTGDRIAIVSDAGMPAISDPGFSLIRVLQEMALPWSVVPGPSSVLTALVLAGFPTDHFTFVGYPPHRKGPRLKFLRMALSETGSVIVLESCHRIRGTLSQIASLDSERHLALVREMTKLHEETLRGNAENLLAAMTGPRLKGELVLLIRGRKPAKDGPGVAEPSCPSQ
jgi:16S rRNA (cytidine1402-2'-O)-methyltransferase